MKVTKKHLKHCGVDQICLTSELNCVLKKLSLVSCELLLPFGQQSDKRTQTKYFLFTKHSKDPYPPDVGRGKKLMTNRKENEFKSEEENCIFIMEEIDENTQMLKLEEMIAGFVELN